MVSWKYSASSAKLVMKSSRCSAIHSSSSWTCFSFLLRRSAMIWSSMVGGLVGAGATVVMVVSIFLDDESDVCTEDCFAERS